MHARAERCREELKMRKASQLWPLFLTCILCLMTRAALAQTETVLYTFTGGSDGGSPYGGLVMDRDGNLYGTTIEYGGGPCTFGYTGCGTVFELTPENGAWTFHVLYAFQGGYDGANPAGTLALDAHGNLYGTTTVGGSLTDFGYGTVFELKRTATGWTEEILYRFTGKAGGQQPFSVVPDEHGTLYGTATFGGDMNCSTEDGAGCGLVFQLKPARAGTWSFRILHTFQGGSDGAQPWAGLMFAPKLTNIVSSESPGSLYGTTKFGGSWALEGDGIVFQLVPRGNDWDYRPLYKFEYGFGAHPAGPFAFDKEGNIYGVTDGGGHCCGTIFELQPPDPENPSWHESELWAYDNNGSLSPWYDGGVVRDSAGNLYGSTDFGDSAFRLTRVESTTSVTWNERPVYLFPGGVDGVEAQTGLILDGKGNAYGMTIGGGDPNCVGSYRDGCGVVYKITGLERPH